MTPGYDILPFVSAVPLSQQPSALAYLKALSNRQRIEQLLRLPGSSGLSEHGKKLLALSSDDPYAPLAWLWGLIGKNVGFSVQMAVRAELEQHEFAAFKDPRIGRANVGLMRALEKGLQYLEKPKPENRGNEDLAHDCACNWIRMDLQRQGHEASCERLIPGPRKHYADVGSVIDGRLCVWEVVYQCHSNLLSHLYFCLLESSAVHTATVVAFTKTHLQKLQQLVHGELSLRPFADRIRFDVVEGYLRRVYK